MASNGQDTMDLQMIRDNSEIANLGGGQIIKLEGGNKAMFLNKNSIGLLDSASSAIQISNATPNVATKIITIARADDGQRVASTQPTHIKIAQIGNQSDSKDVPTRTITLSKTGIIQQKIINDNSPTKPLSSGTPPRQIVQKISLSPMKSPSQISVPSSGRSPHKILQPGQIVTMVSQAGLVSLSQGTTVETKSVSASPSKVFVRPQHLVTQSGQYNPVNSGVSLSTTQNLQPQTMHGSKFQYVRLVSAPTSGVRQLAPANAKSLLNSQTVVSTSNTPNRVSIQPSVQPMQQKSIINSNQRVILPATSQVQIRPHVPAIAPRPANMPTSQSLSSLPPGTTIIQGSQNIPGVQGFALVPAQYVTQLQQIRQPVTQTITPPVVPKTTESAFSPSSTSSKPVRTQNNGPAVEGSGASQRPRKPCNCTKSQCLKLYCDCFANGEFCNNCNCNNCFNNLEHEEERGRAIKACLDRNPYAFKPKIGKGKTGQTTDRRHNKGCNCKRSGCLKNYCECYEAKILCTNLCKCVGCKNFEESPDRKTQLMQLADVAEHRLQQHIVSKSKLSSQIPVHPSKPGTTPTGARLPYSFVTEDVAEATCMCLVAQAEEAERSHQLDVVQECMILEEFGRCLMQVIESANKTNDDT